MQSLIYIRHLVQLLFTVGMEYDSSSLRARLLGVPDRLLNSIMGARLQLSEATPVPSSTKVYAGIGDRALSSHRTCVRNGVDGCTVIIPGAYRTSIPALLCVARCTLTNPFPAPLVQSQDVPKGSSTTCSRHADGNACKHGSYRHLKNAPSRSYTRSISQQPSLHLLSNSA